MRCIFFIDIPEGKGYNKKKQLEGIMMMNREMLLRNIDLHIRMIAEITTPKSTFTLANAEVMVPQVCRTLLNHIYHYSLEEAENLSGIHLLDKESRVAVQLSGQSTRQTIQGNAERFLQSGEHWPFDTLIVLITENDPTPGIGDGFGRNRLNLKILFLLDLIQAIRFLSVGELKALADQLNQDFPSEIEDAAVRKVIFPEAAPLQNLTREQQEVFTFAFFLPENGLHKTLFLHALTPGQRNAAAELICSNWLVQEEDILFRNPKACSTKLAPAETMKPALDAFLDNLWDFEQSWKWERVYHKNPRMTFLRLAELFENAAAWKYCDTAVYARRSAECWLSADEYIKAHEQVEQALSSLDQESNDHQWASAYLYHLNAFCYSELQKHDHTTRNRERALINWKKALDLCCSIPVPLPDQAVAFHYVGLAYSALNDYRSAIEQYEHEISLLEPIRTHGSTRFPHKGLAMAYAMLSDSYRNIGDSENQKFYSYKAQGAKQEEENMPDEVLKQLFSKDRFPTHPLPSVPTASPWFKRGSRDQELAKLESLLRNGDSPVFIYGPGGTGKTEVAIQLAHRINPPKGAFYLKYYDAPNNAEAMRATILQADFSNYLFRAGEIENRRDEYRERMNILRDEYPRALLIIDDFECAGKTLADLQTEESYRELISLGIQLLFVTRYDVGAENGVEIQPLAEGVLLELMRDELMQKEVSDEMLLELIRAVQGRTLLVTLMVKALARTDGPLPEQLLSALSSAGDGQTVSPDATINALLELSGMSKEHHIALGCAALLPTNGMNVDLFRECLPLPKGFDPERLVEAGYLCCEQELLTIPPVIRQFCLRQLVLSDDIYKAFIIALWERFSTDRSCEAVTIRQIAESISIAADKLPEAAADLPVMAAMCWNRLGMHHRALQDYLRALNLWEQNYGPNHFALVRLHQNIGDTYREYGMYKDAQQHYEKALEICNTDPEGRYQLIYYVNTSMIELHNEQGQYKEALWYAQQNLENLEHIPKDKCPPLRVAYHNVCQVYIKMGQYDRAHIYLDKVLELCDGAQAETDPALATYYGCAGHVYTVLAAKDHNPEYQKNALEYQLKALAIQNKTLPQNHPDIATSFSNLGMIYYSLDEFYKALEYQLKAMAIREKVLPLNHPDRASIYHNVGATHYSMGDLRQALEYQNKALEIRNKVLPESHPDRIASCNAVALTHLELGEYTEAQIILQELLQVLKEMPDSDPILLAVTNNRMGLSYGEQGNYEKAEKYLRKALHVFRQIKKSDVEKDSDTFTLATVCSTLGDALFFQEKYVESHKYLTKALEIAQKIYPSGHPELRRLNNAIGYAADMMAG